MFAGKKSAQIREILISESAWEEMTCLFAPSLAFYKEWRNGLEHKFLVVHKSDKPEDIYESYQLIKDILFIKESDFIRHFEHLLQITRSAIFSFAFMVRHEGMKEKKEGIHYTTRELHTKNYSAD